MLADCLVVGEGVFNLPSGVVALVCRSVGVVGVVVAREVELLCGSTVAAPE